MPLGVTKRVLSQANRKFPFAAVIEQQQQWVGRFAERVSDTRWIVYRLVPVDSTPSGCPRIPNWPRSWEL